MAYVKDTIIARRGYASMGDDSWLTKLAGGLFGGYTANQQQQAQLTQAQLDTQKAIAAQSGFGATDVMLLAGAAGAAYLLLRKKKK